MRVLAFDIGGTSIKVGVVNEKGDILEQKELPTLAHEGGEALMNRILKEIKNYKDINRVGISTAGQVDAVEGKIIFASENLPGWTGMEIKKRIEETCGIITAVENDVNAAAIGEANFGAGRNTPSFLCLTYGTGIGGAIVEHKKIYRGAFGSAGEFGHMITHGDGENCNCGGKGCYERYASTSALVRRVKSELKTDEEIDGKTIFEKVDANETMYIDIVNKWIDEIIIGLVNIIHIFNPTLIVLGGGIMCQKHVIEYLRSNLPLYVMPNYDKVKIMPASLGNSAGLLGAALLALEVE